MNTVPGPPPRGERAGTIDKALQVQPGVWDYPEGGPVVGEGLVASRLAGAPSNTIKKDRVKRMQ